MNHSIPDELVSYSCSKAETIHNLKHYLHIRWLFSRTLTSSPDMNRYFLRFGSVIQLILSNSSPNTSQLNHLSTSYASKWSILIFLIVFLLKLRLDSQLCQFSLASEDSTVAQHTPTVGLLDKCGHYGKY